MPPTADDSTATPWGGPRLALWLRDAGGDPSSLVPLPGDVSPRRYARLRAGGTSLILAAYPADMSAVLERFLASTHLLADAGVRVPRVLAVEAESGWVLQEDLGEATLYDRRSASWDELSPWLAAAAEAARRIDSLPLAAVAALGSPPLDPALLARELEATYDALLAPRGFVEPSEETAWREVVGILCARLGEEAPTACHRDFMARNLVPLADGEIGVLDHQDLRVGPRWYDLASLFNDSLFVPASIAERWLRVAEPNGEPPAGYHRAAAQRGLKAAGTFARFAARGVPRHLPLVAPTLARALEHLAQTPEGEAAARTFAPRWARLAAGTLC